MREDENGQRYPDTNRNNLYPAMKRATERQAWSGKLHEPEELRQGFRRECRDNPSDLNCLARTKG